LCIQYSNHEQHTLYYTGMKKLSEKRRTRR
jgi:hypothetical protein